MAKTGAIVFGGIDGEAVTGGLVGGGHALVQTALLLQYVSPGPQNPNLDLQCVSILHGAPSHGPNVGIKDEGMRVGISVSPTVGGGVLRTRVGFEVRIGVGFVVVGPGDTLEGLAGSSGSTFELGEGGLGFETVGRAPPKF